MKRLLSYISVALLCCLSASSCIFEKVETPVADKAIVKLLVSMTSTRASSITKPDSTILGVSYENTIVGVNDIRIFIFENNKKGNYLGEVTKLKMDKSFSNDALNRVITGDLPKSSYGKDVKLVFMANYGMRDTEVNTKLASVKNYSALKALTYSYGSASWSTADSQKSKYIPMSGETSFVVKSLPSNPNKSEVVENYANVSLTRAIAKVRVRLNPKCKDYIITSVRAENPAEKGYCLPQDQVVVPNNSHGLSDILNFSNLSLTNDANKYQDFYLPEQQASNTKLILFMKTTDKNASVEEQKPIEFKFYPDGQAYPIKRNHFYEFIINKKKDQNKVDVQVSIKPWVSHDVNTDFE